MGKLTNYTANDGVATLELCNPPANAYSYDMFREIDEHVLSARMDENVHVIVIQGAGEKFFCAGADISMLSKVTPEFKYYFCLHANETLLRLENTPKLVIAAIDGHCVGGGLEIALAADIRIARDGKAKLGLPEVALGVLPGTGGTQRLARTIGRATAMEMMISGRQLSIEEAKDVGLVHHVISADDDFASAVRDYAKEFCPPRKASMAVGNIKRAVHGGMDLPLESGLALERELQQRLFASSDAKEGLNAYVNKKKPDFSGS